MAKQPQISPQTTSAAPQNLRDLPRAALVAFEKASVPKKVAMVAAGVAVVATSPYWGPLVWRSKTARRVAAAGAGRASTLWFS